MNNMDNYWYAKELFKTLCRLSIKNDVVHREQPYLTIVAHQVKKYISGRDNAIRRIKKGSRN